MRVPNKLPIDSNVTGSQLKRIINQLIDAVKANILSGDLKTTRVNRASSGTTVTTIRKGLQPGIGGGSTEGVTIYWAKVVTVTDANNYTCNIYDRSDEGTPVESSKQVRVFDLVDELIADDWIPVQASNIDGEDYEVIQQMGAVG